MVNTPKSKVSLRRKKVGHVVERNITLTGNFMRYLIDQPRIFESLPEKFELVILPEDDPELRRYNLELLDTYGSEDRPIVFVRVKSSKKTDVKSMHPQVYTPIAA